MNQLTSKSNSSKKLKIDERDNDKLLNDGLNKLEKILEKSFKQEFIQSMVYFIRFEHQNQSEFESNFNKQDIDWLKIEYFLKQFKKICKQKTHLQLLIDKMLIIKKSCEINTETAVDIDAKPSNKLSKKTTINEDYSKLVNELSDFNACEYFSLTNIMVRVLFKLVKSKLTKTDSKLHQDTETNSKLFNLILVLLSSTADVCYYSETRLKILEDPNLKSLLCIFANRISSELMEMIKTKNNPKATSSSNSISKTSDSASYESTSSIYTIENMRKLWSKMCRLSANIFHEKYTQQIKDLFSNEFIGSLCDFLEYYQYKKSMSNSEIDMDDLEFYHSMLRFVKYGCELAKFKNMILEKRLLVYLCRLMFKLNKNLVECDNNKTNEETTSNNDQESTNSNTKENNSKLASIKDLVKQHLLFLDNWSQPISTEYYNQLIEGNAIEHLLYLYAEDITPNDCKQFTRSDSCSTLNSLSSSSTSSSSLHKFNFSEYSFNLLYKLCRDHSSCRAEFGRHGGLSKYISKIESYDLFDSNMNENDLVLIRDLKEYEKLIEMLCLCCKESVNRMRLREQSFLVHLVKLQQKLRLNKHEIFKISKITNNSTEFSWHNKLLVALCCFAHDNESMNVLLSNGLIESLLAYLKESIEEEENIKENEFNLTKSNMNDLFNKLTENNKIPLNDLLNSKETNDAAILRKRKTSEPTLITTSAVSTSIQTSASSSNISSSKKSKRQKLNYELSPPLASSFAHPRLISPTQQNSQSIDSNLCYLTDSIITDQNALYINNNNNNNNQYQWKSPTESYCDSLSPALNAFSPTFSLSPPQNNSRCNSAIMFQSSSASFYLPNQSPNSPMTELSLSPYLNWPNSVDDENNNNNNIQFSPSIKNENSSDEEDIDETENTTLNDFEEQMKKTPTLRKYSSSSSNICDLSFEIGNSLKRSASVASSLDSSTTQHIESINRTEACVFYVLSQLTHGDKPSLFLLNNFNNFDAILSSLLNYLSKAKIRNPRALRILNRLTKNQYCFSNFVLSQFPYKVKKILFNKKDENSTAIKNKNEQDIEKEMNVYLNSNKVFFDAHMFFPSFESIEFTLCNNLKSQCISSSDHGYLNLVAMMKQSSRRLDKVSCALVAPFILRNSKALNYIMVHLNGLDIILDSLLSSNQSQTSEEQKEDLLANESLKYKSVLCIKKMLSFLNYKRNLDQVNSLYDLLRKKFNNKNNNDEANKIDFDLCFTFENDIEKKIEVRSNMLSKKSEYFAALITGDFKESRQRDSNNKQIIQMKEVAYETFSILIYMLGCGHELNDASNFLLTFELCYDLILACDRFFLIELKDLFISILICKFLSLSTWSMCFKLAYYLNNSYLANASMDFLLSKLEIFPIMKSKLSIQINKDDENDECVNKMDLEKDLISDNEECIEFFDVLEYLLDSLKNEPMNNSNSVDQDKKLIDYFRKVLKTGLIEVIKNNHWKL